MATQLKGWETFRDKLKQQGREVNEHPTFKLNSKGQCSLNYHFLNSKQCK